MQMEMNTGNVTGTRTDCQGSTGGSAPDRLRTRNDGKCEHGQRPAGRELQITARNGSNTGDDCQVDPVVPFPGTGVQ